MRKEAFTLIELLVVVAILAILLAILMPGLNMAREQGRRAQCANNLRQHGVAWYLYLDDHNNVFPPFNLTPKEGGVAFAPYPSTFGGKSGVAYDSSYSAEYRILNRYLDIVSETSPNLDIFKCPNDMKPALVVSTTYNIFDYYGNSYLGNNFILAHPNYLDNGMPLSRITSSSSKVFLEYCNIENTPGHGLKGPDVDNNGDPPVRVMVLFLDGHVAGPYSARGPKRDFERYDPATDKPIIEIPDGVNY